MFSSFCWRSGLMAGLIFIFGWAAELHADVVADITADFKPVAGYVVMSEGDEFIIDLDKTHGVSPGDIFSVIAPGKKIVHPVTQKVLGSLEEVKGILKVTRVKSNFSFARPVGNAENIKRGDPIRRYSNLTALFWDYTGKGRPLFDRLQKALPDLKWQAYSKAQGSRPPQPEANPQSRGSLTFVFTADALEVYDPEFLMLQSYPIAEPRSEVGPSVPAGASAVTAAVATQPGPEAKPTAPVRKAAGDAPLVKFSEAHTIASLPDVSLIADFIRYDNQLLMASTDGAQIRIFDVTGNVKPIAKGAPSYPVRILSVKWWTPDEGHPLYLAANVWSDRDKNVRGNLFLLEGDTLKLKLTAIPRILGTFDLDRDGWPETLLGQEFVGDTFFGRRLNELKLVDDKLSYSDPPIELPRHFVVLGSYIGDLTGDGRPETVYVSNRILYIYSGKERRYKSPKDMGGSLSFLTYAINPNFKDIQTTTVSFEISPVAGDLDGDGIPELLAVASSRDIFGSLSISPGVKRSWLAIFKYKDGRFESGTLGNELENPLQGLTMGRDRILLVATAAGNLVGEGANSHLLSYALAR